VQSQSASGTLGFVELARARDDVRRVDLLQQAMQPDPIIFLPDDLVLASLGQGSHLFRMLLLTYEQVPGSSKVLVREKLFVVVEFHRVVRVGQHRDHLPFPVSPVVFSRLIVRFRLVEDGGPLLRDRGKFLLRLLGSRPPPPLANVSRSRANCLGSDRREQQIRRESSLVERLADLHQQIVGSFEGRGHGGHEGLLVPLRDQ